MATLPIACFAALDTVCIYMWATARIKCIEAEPKSDHRNEIVVFKT